jgi:hypothetical protein
VPYLPTVQSFSTTGTYSDKCFLPATSLGGATTLCFNDWALTNHAASQHSSQNNVLYDEILSDGVLIPQKYTVYSVRSSVAVRFDSVLCGIKNTEQAVQGAVSLDPPPRQKNEVKKMK